MQNKVNVRMNRLIVPIGVYEYIILRMCYLGLKYKDKNKMIWYICFLITIRSLIKIIIYVIIYNRDISYFSVIIYYISYNKGYIIIKYI